MPLLFAALLLLGRGGFSFAASDANKEVLFPDLPRVRAADPDLTSAIWNGQRLSPTFRQLVNTLQRSNVVVFFERNNRLRRQEAGRLKLAGVASGLRYVQVSLSTSLSQRELIVFIAHELAHAVEIAAAEKVVDDRSMLDLYCRIGFVGSFGFDTEGAQRVTEIVGEEVHQNADR